MALTTCKECKKEISSSADSCPHCGFKPYKFKFGFFDFLILLLIISGINYCVSENPKPKVLSTDTFAESHTSVDTNADDVQPVVTEVPMTWIYSEFVEEITGDIVKYAHLTSNNSIELDFPHQPGTNAGFLIRRHPNNKLAISVSVTKGQLNCYYDDCYINVRHDNGKVTKHYVTEPADHSYRTWFFDNPKKILNEIKSAKKTYIELRFFQQGEHTFEFNTEGFEENNIKQSAK